MGFPNIWNLIPWPNLTHLATYICVYMCVCACVCTQMCVGVYIYIYTHTHTHTRTHVWVHTHTRVYTCMYIYPTHSVTVLNSWLGERERWDRISGGKGGENGRRKYKKSKSKIPAINLKGVAFCTHEGNKLIHYTTG